MDNINIIIKLNNMKKNPSLDSIIPNGESKINRQYLEDYIFTYGSEMKPQHFDAIIKLLEDI